MHSPSFWDTLLGIQPSTASHDYFLSHCLGELPHGVARQTCLSTFGKRCASCPSTEGTASVNGMLRIYWNERGLRPPAAHRLWDLPPLCHHSGP